MTAVQPLVHRESGPTGADAFPAAGGRVRGHDIREFNLPLKQIRCAASFESN